MANRVSDDVFVRALNQMGIATLDQIEAARLVQSNNAKKGILLPLSDVLIQQGIITAAIRDNVEKKLLAVQQGGIQKLGNFKLLKKIGEGGMGAVFLAEDTAACRKVAVKVLPRKYAGDTEFITRFYREAKLTGKLNHVNIVSAFTVGEDLGNHYYAMEYCDGESLDDRLKREKVLPWDKAIDIVMQVARGLNHAHEHELIHRDIKPANILITKEGVAKILDMGLSKNIGDSNQSFNTQTGVAMGTPHYISPEQARGDKNVDGRADIYSLGATLYHLVTGQTPFEGSTAAMIMMKHLSEQLPNPQDIRDDIPEGVVHVIQKMMAKEPVDRHADCKELLEDLELVLGGKMPSSRAIDVGKSSVAMRLKLHPPRRGDGTRPQAPVERRQRTEERRRDTKNLVPQKTNMTVGLAAVGAGVLFLIFALWFGYKSHSDGVRTSEAAAKDSAKDLVRAPASEQPSPDTKAGTAALSRENHDVPRAISASANADGWIDLLPLINLQKDSVAGESEFKDAALMIKKGRVQIPYRPPDEYDFRIVFTRIAGWDAVVPILARGSKSIEWSIAGWHNSRSAFERVDGQSGDTNMTTAASTIENGQKITAVVQVRRDGLKGFINNLLVCEHKTDFSDCSNPFYELHDPTLLGVATFADPAAFYSIQVREISGHGQFTRPDEPAAKMAMTQQAAASPPAPPPLDENWIKLVRAIPPEKQVELVGAKLKELNPGFDGSVGAIKDTNNNTISAVRVWTNKVRDLAPLKGFPQLHKLVIADGNGGAVTNLWPLRGMALYELDASLNHELRDLTPLAGMPLVILNIKGTAVSDLTQLRNLPLKELLCDFKPERDGAFLKSFKTLEKINDVPVAEFWSKYGDVPTGGHNSELSLDNPERWKNAVDLMPIIRREDVVKGQWGKDGSRLTIDNTADAVIEIPYEPPPEYDFRVEFTPVKRNDVNSVNIKQILSAARHSFAWTMFPSMSVGIFEQINGKDVGNPSMHEIPPIVEGHKFSSIVQVRAHGVKAFLDGKLVCEWKTDYADMGPGVWKLRHDNILGLGSHQMATAFTRVEVLEITGKGAFLGLDDSARWKNAVDLMPLIAPQTDKVAGNWQKNGNSISCDRQDFARIEIPYQPPEEYDFKIVFEPTEKRAEGGGDVTQILSKYGHSFLWMIGGYGNSVTGFDVVAGQRAADQQGVLHLPNTLEPQRQYTAIVQVRNSGLRSYLNGRLINEVKTDYRNLSIFPSWKLRDESILGIGCWGGTIFNSIEVLEINGKGKIIRADDSSTRKK